MVRLCDPVTPLGKHPNQSARIFYVVTHMSRGYVMAGKNLKHFAKKKSLFFIFLASLLKGVFSIKGSVLY